MHVPAIKEKLPWGELISEATPALLSALNTGRVEYLDTSPKIEGVDIVVGLDGLYLESEKNAREVVVQLEGRLKLIYVDY